MERESLEYHLIEVVDKNATYYQNGNFSKDNIDILNMMMNYANDKVGESVVINQLLKHYKQEYSSKIKMVESIDLLDNMSEEAFFIGGLLTFAGILGESIFAYAGGLFLGLGFYIVNKNKKYYELLQDDIDAFKSTYLDREMSEWTSSLRGAKPHIASILEEKYRL